MTATTTPNDHKHDEATTAGKTFSELGVEDTLAEALADKGITHAFPIQELTLPLALGGADIIGQARTGTGKTLGFGLPLLSRVDVDKAKTQALVVVPTRELCIQVADDLAIGAARGVRVQSVYGGVGYDEQIDALTTGVHVVVGTPGRTIDHLNRGNLDLSEVHVVVLDEADEMLDMGFLPDVERLLKACPEDRQTLLFSATMPSAVVKLARRFMSTPTFMQADTEAHETAPNVDQYFFTVHRMDKPRVLARILQSPDRGGAFVFCRTKRMCDRLVDELDGLGVAAIAVHGDLRQSSREKNLDKFRDGKADVLVATEVAARGLDVDNVTHVVNYDCPDDEKMYLHRIGRTARAGNKGVAVTFAEFNESDRANVIRKKVDAENEMQEVFSTSDELVEWFDLPAETPWDHLTREARGKSGGRGSKPRSSSSGKSRSSKTSGQSSRDDSSRRSRSKDDSRKDDSRSSRSDRSDDRAKETSKQSAPKQESSRSRSSESSDGDRSRTRTRTRTRTRDEDGGGSSRSSSRDDRGDDRSRSRDDSGSSRSRSRSSGGSDDTGSSQRSRSDDGGSSSSTSGGARSRSRRQTTSEDRSSGGKRSSSDRESSRGGSSNGDRAGSNDRSRSRSRDDDGGGRDRDSQRSSSNSRSNSGRSSGRSSETSRTSSSAVRTTSRGEDARGEGTPRHSRRVEVEHLP